MDAGIYPAEQISHELYHAGPGISKSGLDQIDRSPLHYWAKYLDPQREPWKTTRAKTLGSALHCLLGEPNNFEKKFCQTPKIENHPAALRTVDDIKARLKDLGLPVTGRKDHLIEKVKAADPAAVIWDEFLALQTAGKEILFPAEWERLHGMRDAIARHPISKILLGKGSYESSFYWIDEETGELCKCRPDFISPEGIVVDFKTSEDASPLKFQRSAFGYRYQVQAAWYLEGVMKAALQAKPDAPKLIDPSSIGPFIFLAIESSAPFAIGLYEADEEVLARGRLEFRSNLKTYSECRRANRWPGYSQQIQPLGLPRYAAPLEIA